MADVGLVFGDKKLYQNLDDKGNVGYLTHKSVFITLLARLSLRVIGFTLKILKLSIPLSENG